MRPLSRATVTPLLCPVGPWMRDQVQAPDSEYHAQVQAPEGEYHAQVQLCAASYDADLSAPLNDAYHAEAVPHDRTPRTSQRRVPGGDIHRRSQMVRHGTLTPIYAGSTPAACASSALLAMPTTKRLAHHSTARCVGSTAGRERCSSDAEPSVVTPAVAALL